jgi:hypothetical protein
MRLLEFVLDRPSHAIVAAVVLMVAAELVRLLAD